MENELISQMTTLNGEEEGSFKLRHEVYTAVHDCSMSMIVACP